MVEKTVGSNYSSFSKIEEGRDVEEPVGGGGGESSRKRKQKLITE